jgi:peptide/nickel transport system substrate-binding protein
VSLFFAGCGDDSSGSSAQAPASSTTSLVPKAGGSLTYGSFSEVPSFDPVVNSGSGNSGGIELFALYDALMTYNTDKGQYEPRIAQSLEPNADASVWTLKLRPNVKFSDGTPYDAAAVVFNLQRQIDAKGRSYNLVRFMKSFETPDPQTVVITLTEPNTTIPYALSQAPGAIASPAAIKAAGTNFGTSPGAAGAGPFVLSSFKPKESVTFKKNPNYWGGQVYLDELKFVVFATQQATLEAMKAGTIQGAFIRDPVVLASARDAKFQELTIPVSAGNSIEINNGVKVSCKGGEPASVCAGQPDGASVPTKPVTTDKRIRQAVAAAINVDTLNTRVWSGKAEASTDMLSKDSKWYSNVSGPKFDLEKAKKLVSEVKAEGKWDGTIRVDCHNGLPDWGIAVQTMLEAAGFKVNLSATKDVAANIALVQTRKEFDLACWGVSIYDEEPFAAVSREMGSTGWTNATVTTAIASGQKAKDDAGKKAALETIAKAYTDEVPFLGVTHVIQSNSFVNSVHGVSQTVGSSALFDKAWIGS